MLINLGGEFTDIRVREDESATTQKNSLSVLSKQALGIKAWAWTLVRGDHGVHMEGHWCRHGVKQFRLSSQMDAPTAEKLT